MDDTPRQLRLGSTIRGLIIGALAALYGLVFNEPGVSLVELLLLAAGLQVGVLLLRRFVAAESQPQALHLLELIVDGATVLLFAVGVFGGVARLIAAD